jgi:putative oxidoreductase
MMFRKLVLNIIGTRIGWAALPLRLSLGVIFMAHGSQKLFGFFGGPGLHAMGVMFETKMGLAPGLLWATLAGCGEFFGGLLVLIGLLTRFGALNICVVMLVAIFHVHWGKFFLPAGMEYPLGLLGSALALLIGGGGRLSLDHAIAQGVSGERKEGGVRDMSAVP